MIFIIKFPILGHYQYDDFSEMTYNFISFFIPSISSDLLSSDWKITSSQSAETQIYWNLLAINHYAITIDIQIPL